MFTLKIAFGFNREQECQEKVNTRLDPDERGAHDLNENFTIFGNSSKLAEIEEDIWQFFTNSKTEEDIWQIFKGTNQVTP